MLRNETLIIFIHLFQRKGFFTIGHKFEKSPISCMLLSLLKKIIFMITILYIYYMYSIKSESIYFIESKVSKSVQNLIVRIWPRHQESWDTSKTLPLVSTYKLFIGDFTTKYFPIVFGGVKKIFHSSWGGKSHSPLFKNGKRRFLHGRITYNAAKELAAYMRLFRF